DSLVERLVQRGKRRRQQQLDQQRFGLPRRTAWPSGRAATPAASGSSAAWALSLHSSANVDGSNASSISISSGMDIIAAWA
ncbi:hypothetical protein PF011_g32444, partial [Phytophthora fragariae]